MILSQILIGWGMSLVPALLLVWSMIDPKDKKWVQALYWIGGILWPVVVALVVAVIVLGAILWLLWQLEGMLYRMGIDTHTMRRQKCSFCYRENQNWRLDIAKYPCRSCGHMLGSDSASCNVHRSGS